MQDNAAEQQQQQQKSVEMDDVQAVLLKLSQQVERLSERLADLEEHVGDLNTDIRLQARRCVLLEEQRSAAAVVPPLTLLQQHHSPSHDGTSSVFGSAAASPRVAGPVLSAAGTPRGRCSSRPSSLVGVSTASHAAQSLHPASTASAAASPRPAAAAAAIASPPMQPAANDAGAGAAGADGAEASSALGVFGLVKTWGGGVMTDNTEATAALQAATAAATAAAAAEAAADRCQQQVLELRGRQGQSERRLETLWQLQETASSNQAALAQLQELLEQQQQLQTKQQDYMVALRAQVSQANAACAGGHASCDELRAGLQQLQSRVDGTCRDLVRQGDQLADVHEKQQAAIAALRLELSSANQQLARRLDSQQGRLDTCAAAAAGALGKCEDMRQAAVVLAGRMDAVTGQIRAAVDPLNVRVTELGTQGAAWSKSASLTKTAVQQEQLAASLAQVSTAAARKDHERAQQVAGLAARLEVLEKEGTKREQIVTQEDLQHTLSELRADTAASLRTTVQQLTQQLRAKADEAAINKVTSNLAERFNASETSLLLSLRSLRDKTALMLDLNQAAVKKWQQEVGDSFAELRAAVSRTAAPQQQQSQHAQHAQQQQAAVRPRDDTTKFSPRSGLKYHASPPGSRASVAHAAAAAHGAGGGGGGNSNIVAVSAVAALAGVLGACDSLLQVGTVPVPAAAVATAEAAGGCGCGDVEGPSVAQCVAAAEAALAIGTASAPTQQPASNPEASPAAAAAAVVTTPAAAVEALPQAQADVTPAGAVATAVAVSEAAGSVATPEAVSEAAAATGSATSAGAVAEADGSPAAAMTVAAAAGSRKSEGNATTGAAAAGGRKTSRSQSHGFAATAATGTAQAASKAGSLAHHAGAEQEGRPFSALQGWSAAGSRPSTSAADLHGASTNAKLVQAAQQKAAAREQLAQKKVPHHRATASHDAGGAQAAAFLVGTHTGEASSSPQQRLKHSASAITGAVAGSRSSVGSGASKETARLSLNTVKRQATTGAKSPGVELLSTSSHASTAQHVDSTAGS